MSAPTFARALPRLLILALASALGFALNGSFSTVQEGAKAELALTDVQLGLIQGVGVAVPMVLFSIPIGLLVDRRNRVRLLWLFAALSVGGTLLTAAASGMALLVIARMLVGIGMTGGLTCALSLAADLCAPEARGRAVLIVNLGKALGIAAGFALAGWLYGQFVHGSDWLGTTKPWRAAHYALTAIGTAAAALLLSLREPPRREVEAAPDAPLRIVVGELWARRGFLLPLFIGQVSVVMADAAANIWAAPVLTRNYGLGPQDFAGWVGALLFGTGLAGSIFGGFVADWGQRNGRRGGLLIGAVAAAAIGVPAALFPLSATVPVFAVAFGTLALAGNITGLVTSVALTVYLPNELRGLCIGAFIALAGLVGFGLAPPLVSWLSLLRGGEQHLASSLAIVGVVTGILSLIAFYVAMRNAPRSAREAI